MDSRRARGSPSATPSSSASSAGRAGCAASRCPSRRSTSSRAAAPVRASSASAAGADIVGSVGDARRARGRSTSSAGPWPRSRAWRPVGRGRGRPATAPGAAVRSGLRRTSRCSAAACAGVRPTATHAVFWYRNPDRPSPLTSGNIDTEIQTALAAWTNPPTASLTLTFGGTRSAGGASVTDVFCIAANSGAGLISFEDPENDIGSGVLAVGGGCAGGPVHTVNGQTSQLRHGFVVFNDAASLGASYRMRAQLHPRADARDRPRHRPRPHHDRRPT